MAAQWSDRDGVIAEEVAGKEWSDRTQVITSDASAGGAPAVVVNPITGIGGAAAQPIA